MVMPEMVVSPRPVVDDRDDDYEPEPIEVCGKTNPHLARLGIPHKPCPMPAGHDGWMHYFESI